MQILAVILILVGVGLFWFNTNQSKLLRNLKLAHSSNIADLKNTAQAIATDIGSGHWREYVRIWGQITTFKPMLSEIKQEPCVHYKMSVRRIYEERVRSENEEGDWEEETHQRVRTVASNQRSIPFFLEDKTGKIEVNPDNAKIDTVQILDEFIPGEARGGMLQKGNFSLVLNSSISTSQNKTLGYGYRESILPLGREVLILGEISDETGNLKIGKPVSSQQPFLISLKSYESLSQNINQNKKKSFYGMITCLIIGFSILIFSLL